MPSYGTNDERGAGAWTNIAEEAEHGGDGTKEPVVNVYTKLKDQRQCSACSLWGRRRFFGDWEWREAAPRCWKCVKAKRAAKDAAFHKGRPDFVKQNSVKTGLALNRPKKQAESAYSAAKLAADRPTLNRDPSSASNPGADPDRTHGRASVSFDDAALPGLPPVRRAKPAGPPKPYDPDAGVPEVRRSTLYPGAGYRPSSRSQSERLGGAPSPLYRRSDRSDRRADTAASASASAFASLPNSERRASASTSASASARLSRDFPGGFLGSSSRSPLDERYERSRRLDALRGLRLEDEFERRVSGGYPSLHETTASLHETTASLPSPARSHAGAYGRRRGDDFLDAPGDGDGDASAFPRGRRSSAAFGMSSSVDRFGERRVDSVRGRPGGGSRSRSRSPRGGGSPSSFGTGGVVVPGFKLGTRRCSECGLSGKSNRFADEEWDAPRETRVCLSCAEGGGGGAGGGAGGSRVSPLGGRTGASARSARALGYASARRDLHSRDPPGDSRGPSSPGFSPPAPYDAYSISSRGGDASLDPDGGGDFGEGGSPFSSSEEYYDSGGSGSDDDAARVPRGARRSRRRSGGSRRSAVSLLDPNGSSSQRSPPSPGAGLWFGATARAPDRAYRALADACLLSEEDAFLYRSVSVGRYSEATGGRSKRGEAASYLRRFVSRVAELGMAPEWWTEAHLEELCARAADPSSGLYLRPVDGGVRAARSGGRLRAAATATATEIIERWGLAGTEALRDLHFEAMPEPWEDWRGRRLTGVGLDADLGGAGEGIAAYDRSDTRDDLGDRYDYRVDVGRRNLMEEPDGGTRGGDGAYARGYGDLLAGAGDLEPDRRGGSRSEDASRDERDGFPRGRRSSPSSSLSPGPGRRLGGPPSTLRPLARSRGGAGSMPVRGDTERADAARGGGAASPRRGGGGGGGGGGGVGTPRAPAARRRRRRIERRRRRRRVLLLLLLLGFRVSRRRRASPPRRALRRFDDVRLRPSPVRARRGFGRDAGQGGGFTRRRRLPLERGGASRGRASRRRPRRVRAIGRVRRLLRRRRVERAPRRSVRPARVRPALARGCLRVSARGVRVRGVGVRRGGAVARHERRVERLGPGRRRRAGWYAVRANTLDGVPRRHRAFVRAFNSGSSGGLNGGTARTGTGRGEGKGRGGGRYGYGGGAKPPGGAARRRRRGRGGAARPGNARGGDAARRGGRGGGGGGRGGVGGRGRDGGGGGGVGG